MANCTHCGQEWTTKDKIKIYFTFAQSKNCSYCGIQQFLSPAYKRRSGYMTMLMIFFMFLPGFFNAPWQTHLIIFLSAVILNFILQIRLIELHDKEEYLF